MRTPAHMAIKLVDDISRQGAAYIYSDACDLLTAWRDECVDEKDAIIRARDALVGILTAERDAAMRPEAPASEDEYTDEEIEEMEATSRELGAGGHVHGISKPITITKDPPKPWYPGDPRVEPFMVPVSDELHKHGLSREVRVPIYNRAYEAVEAALLSRAPRAESEKEKNMSYDEMNEAAWITVRDEWKARAEAAEAERDDLRERVEGMTQTMREMLDHMNKDEAERDRLKGELAHGILEATNRALDKNQKLREENEALRKAIDDFCEGQDWAATNWKQMGHIAPLFKIRAKGETK